MKLSHSATKIILAVIIMVSLAVSCVFMATKSGYHEDELLTYHLANSSAELGINSDWNTAEAFNDYLTAGEHRFDYQNVYQNQVIDASHPPLYYALIHTVCSFFPHVFNRWLAFAVNIVMLAGALVLLFQIGRRVTGSDFYALIGTGAYALSIAFVTTADYLRMYASLTFWVLLFLYLTLRLYDKQGAVKITNGIPVLITVALGTLTQYYFILCAGLIGLVYLVFSVKERHIKLLLLYIGAAVIGAGVALAVYPYIIGNVLGGNRGFGSLKMDIDAITVLTYCGYKLICYLRLLAKDLFLNQLWLLAVCTVAAAGSFAYLRFVKKRKLPRKAWFIIVPAAVYFVFIALVSPFNSDRYIMAVLPLLALLFTFAFIRLFNLFNGKWAQLIVPVCIVAASAAAFVWVKPYYLYGETDLYRPVTKNAVFVGTAMMEWNKCIDKFMNYDSVMIAQTTDMDPALTRKLEQFAQQRGIITNGKIGSLAQSFMTNGDVNREQTDSIGKMLHDDKLLSLDSVTVYISRLADEQKIIDVLLSEAGFKHCDLIQKDREFEEFYNWYDYFAQTESYCNVYGFSR